MTSEVDPKLLPTPEGDAPLHKLTRDQLSAFLYAAFNGEELLDLCRKAKVLVTGGYRIDSLNDVERSDLLADEIRAAPKAADPVLAKLREIYEFPALDHVVLPKVVADEVAALSVESDAPIRMIWRLIADPSEDVFASGAAGLDVLADELFGPPGEKPPPVEGEEAQPEGPPQPDAETRALRKQVGRVSEQAERAQSKVESLKQQLAMAHEQSAKHEREATARAKELAKSTAELELAREQLAQARKEGGIDQLKKLEKERGDLANRAASLEEKLRASNELREKLEAELESAKKSAGEKRAPEPPRTEDAESQLEAVPASWLFPRFTREFYDSLEKWDERIQRAAFKQAFLLAENHRHPSLRAIPLEGIPGYYRVRIATDVRLIYRRSENEREVEILSLIDREDLDRYIRQAKTR